jgi:hypothetical protein
MIASSTWVESSRNGFSVAVTIGLRASTDNGLVAIGGRVIWRHRRCRRDHRQASLTVAACIEKSASGASNGF